MYNHKSMALSRPKTALKRNHTVSDCITRTSQQVKPPKPIFHSHPHTEMYLVKLPSSRNVNIVDHAYFHRYGKSSLSTTRIVMAGTIIV